MPVGYCLTRKGCAARYTMVDLTIRFLSGLSPIGKDGGASPLWLVVDRLLGLLAWAAIVCAIAGIVWLLLIRV